MEEKCRLVEHTLKPVDWWHVWALGAWKKRQQGISWRSGTARSAGKTTLAGGPAAGM